MGRVVAPGGWQLRPQRRCLRHRAEFIWLTTEYEFGEHQQVGKTLSVLAGMTVG